MRQTRNGHVDPEWEKLRRFVEGRAGGRCEARISPDCTGRGVHAHHIRLRSQGGPDDEQNLAWVCVYCHDYIHLHPIEARDRGLIRWAGDTPPRPRGVLRHEERLRAGGQGAPREGSAHETQDAPAADPSRPDASTGDGASRADYPDPF